MSLTGLLIGVIEIIITVAVLLLIGYLVQCACVALLKVSIPAIVQRLYGIIVAADRRAEATDRQLGQPVARPRLVLDRDAFRLATATTRHAVRSICAPRGIDAEVGRSIDFKATIKANLHSGKALAIDQRESGYL